MSILGYLARITLLGVTALTVCGIPAAAQGDKQQVIRLTDPTPRQPDLEQKYNGAPVASTAPGHDALVLNQQRHALITKAVKQLGSLAAVLSDGLVKHQQGASLAPEVQIADLIEKLAKNVNAAVKLDARSAKPGSVANTATSSSSGETPEAQLRQDAGKLVSVVQELQAEVGKSNQDTLSLGILTKSAEVERAARSLKDRMKKRADG